MKKSVKDEMVVMLQRKTKEQEETIKQLKRQTEELKKGESGAENKIKALNEIHSQKTKALLKSINLLKKEIQKIKYEGKESVRHQKNLKLMEDIKLQDIAMGALKKEIGDEDKCNNAILRELQKGPSTIRALSREELKIEVKKYKNISIKIMKEMQKNGQKLPSYTNGLAKEMEGPPKEVGLKQEKSSKKGNEDDFENDSMFGGLDIEIDNAGEEEEEKIPEKVQQRIDKLEDEVCKLNLDLKDKNEKILELLSESEEIKIQVFARDKSIELQQKQIEELLEELRESKGLENDVKILMQKKMALENDKAKLQEELNRGFLSQNETQGDSEELIMINNGLKDQVKQLAKQVADERKIRQQEVARFKKELTEYKNKYESTTKEALTKERQIDAVRNKSYKIEEEARNEALKEQDKAKQALAEAEKFRKEAAEHRENMIKREKDSAAERERQEAEFKKQWDAKMAEMNNKNSKIQELEMMNGTKEQQHAKELEQMKREAQLAKRQMEATLKKERDAMQATLATTKESMATQAKQPVVAAQKTAEEKRQARLLRQQQIEAEEEIENLKQENLARAEMERQQRVLNLSRGRSAGKKQSAAESQLEVDEDVLASTKKTNPFAQDRIQTAPPRQPQQQVPNLSNMNQMARPSTGNAMQKTQPEAGSREAKKMQREMALKALEEDEEKERRAEEAEVNRKAQLFDDMQRRKSSKSPTKVPKNDPTEVEMEGGNTYNQNLGASFDSDYDEFD